MTRLIDRRLNGKNKSAVNRQRFLHRFRKEIKKAVNEAVKKRNITDIESGEEIVIPAKDVKEYQFGYGKKGLNRSIHPGNKEFIEGDKIQKPSHGTGQSDGQASQEGQGEDHFKFQISSDEFLNIFFDDLELPEMVKKELSKVKITKTLRQGYTTSGVPTNINVVRSMRGALARRIALQNPHKKKLLKLEAQLADLPEDSHDKEAYLEKIEILKKKIRAIPYIDTFDLRYNNRVKVMTPSTQAVMFCIMDVSGSMDKIKKDIAKRFFILLYLFLQKNYEKVELVFIRHHTTAKQVDEKEFFYSRETGGTVVSSALTLMSEIMKKDYNPNAWNIYAAQASDGDNWNADSPACKKIMEDEIIDLVQYYAYVEIMPRLHQSLWEMYDEVKSTHKNFAMKTIDDYADIYPVFRALFKRKAHEKN